MRELIACLLIGRIKNPFEGVFDEGWEFDEYRAWNIDKWYSIWIANWADFLKDDKRYTMEKEHKPFVNWASSIEKYLIWKAFERIGRKQFEITHNL